jgi:ribose-phosphate pyrophosphokinase
MIFPQPVNLGIIACPGAETFTEKIVSKLKTYYKGKHKNRVEHIVKTYGIDEKDVERQINLLMDIENQDFEFVENIEKFKIPKFKVDTKYTRFANGEFKVEIQDSVRGMDVYIIQDVENHYPIDVNKDNIERVLSVNDHIFMLFLTIDAVVQSGANSISVVVPAYPYARQHKRNGREALTAALFGRIVENMGVSRIITLDIHSKEIENCLNKCRMENLYASYQILKKLKNVINIKDPNLVIVAPDTGAVDRNKFYASNLKRPLAMLYKERDYSKVAKDAKTTNIKSMRLIGDVKDKVVFMADDMVGTGGTLIKAMKHLRENGAKKVICAISLPFFTDNKSNNKSDTKTKSAIEAFDEAYKQGFFDKIIGTNAVYHDKSSLLSREWYEYAEISELFAHIISRLYQKRTLTPVIDNNKKIQSLIIE